MILWKKETVNPGEDGVTRKKMVCDMTAMMASSPNTDDTLFKDASVSNMSICPPWPAVGDSDNADKRRSNS